MNDELQKASQDAADAIAQADETVQGQVGRRRALITGITGQDGAYLAALLLSQGFDVAGLVRRSTGPNPAWRLHALLGDRAQEVRLISGDMLDSRSLDAAVEEAYPTHVFNLAAQSFVGASFTEPENTMQVTGYGAVRLYDACLRFAARGVRVYQASSSEMFGSSEAPQSIETPMHPCSPYGCAKLYAHHMANVYRNGYGLDVRCGILFNHESPLRGREFVTQSVAIQVAACALGGANTIRVGNLDAIRDWGYAGDYVRAMAMMLEHEGAEDFVVATGESHTVGCFVREAIAAAVRNGDERVGDNLRRSQVVVDETLVRARPYEVPDLRGDIGKTEEVLGWKPMTTFDELVEMMVVASMERVNSHFGTIVQRMEKEKASAAAASRMN